MQEEDGIVSATMELSNQPQHQDGVPDVVSASSCSASYMDDESSSESSFDISLAMESSLEESKVQVDFAEQTAHEMQEWMDFWNKYHWSPEQKLSFAESPQNSLNLEEEDDDEGVSGCIELIGIYSDIEEDYDLDCNDCLDSACHDSWCNSPATMKAASSHYLSPVPMAVPLTPFSDCSAQSSQNHEEAEKDTAFINPVCLFTDHSKTLHAFGDDEDETEELSKTVLDLYSIVSISTEDLHLEARGQKFQVDDICRRSQWMEECLVAALHEEDGEPSSSSSSSCTQSTVPNDYYLKEAPLPPLRYRDRIYLCAAACCHLSSDLAYSRLCAVLPFEWLQSWIWIHRQTSPRTRQIMLSAVVIFLALLLQWFSSKPLLKPPPSPRCFATNMNCVNTLVISPALLDDSSDFFTNYILL